MARGSFRRDHRQPEPEPHHDDTDYTGNADTGGVGYEADTGADTGDAIDHGDAGPGDASGDEMATSESNGHDAVAQPGEPKKGKRTDDDRRKTFSDVATPRASAILDAMRKLRNCANTQTYKWDEGQENKLFGTLQAELDAMRELFASARIAAEQPREARRRGRGSGGTKSYSLPL